MSARLPSGSPRTFSLLLLHSQHHLLLFEEMRPSSEAQVKLYLEGILHSVSLRRPGRQHPTAVLPTAESAFTKLCCSFTAQRGKPSSIVAAGRVRLPTNTAGAQALAQKRPAECRSQGRGPGISSRSTPESGKGGPGGSPPSRRSLRARPPTRLQENEPRSSPRLRCHVDRDTQANRAHLFTSQAQGAFGSRGKSQPDDKARTCHRESTADQTLDTDSGTMLPVPHPCGCAPGPGPASRLSLSSPGLGSGSGASEATHTHTHTLLA